MADNGIEINENISLENNGTVRVESATQTAILASIYLRGWSEFTIWAKSKLACLLNSKFTRIYEILIYETRKQIFEMSF